MSALGEALRSLSRVLDERGLRWFVFGAQAVAIRGAPRATQDVDVTVEVSRVHLRPLVEALEAEGIGHRNPEIAEELLDSGAVLPMSHPSGMEIDLVLAGSGLEDLALDRATRVRIEEVDVPVAHATDLVVMKALAGRGKDLEDIRAVLAGGDVDVAEARDLLGQLEHALGRSDLLPLWRRRCATSEGTDRVRGGTEPPPRDEQGTRGAVERGRRPPTLRHRLLHPHQPPGIGGDEPEQRHGLATCPHRGTLVLSRRVHGDAVLHLVPLARDEQPLPRHVLAVGPGLVGGAAARGDLGVRGGVVHPGGADGRGRGAGLSLRRMGRKGDPMRMLLLSTLLVGCPKPGAPEPIAVEGEGPGIQARVAGEGPTLVLLHGFGASSDSWRDAWEVLPDHFRVVAVEAPGVSGSEAWADFGVASHEAQLLELLDRLAADQAYLVGHSMGGQVALSFAAHHPDRVAGVALIDPSGHEPTEVALATMGRVARFAGQPYGPWTRDFVRAVVTEVRAGDPAPDPVVEAYAERWHAEAGREALLRAQAEFRLIAPDELYAAHWTARSLAGDPPQHSMLVVWGEDDPWFPVEQADRFAASLTGARVVRVAGAGHLAHEQQPEQVYAEIVAGFDGVDDPPVAPELGRAGLEGWLVGEVAHRRSYAAEAWLAAGLEPEPLVLGATTTGPGSLSVGEAVVAVGAPAVDPLLARLRDEVRGTRRAAARLLGEIGDIRALQPLLDLALDESTRSWGCQALAGLGEHAWPVAIGWVASGDKGLARCGMVVLGTEPDARLVETYAAALEVPSSSVIRKAVDALAAVGGEEAHTLIVPLLEHPSSQVRAGAARAMVALGDDARTASLLLDAGYHVRLAAQEALDERGGHAAVLDALPDEPSTPSAELCEVLAATGDPRAVPWVVAGLASEDEYTRRKAATSLIPLARHVRFDTLVATLGDDDELVAEAAAQALAEAGDPAALPVLLDALDGASFRQELATARALGRWGHEEHLEAVDRLMADEDAAIREAAAVARARITGAWTAP